MRPEAAKYLTICGVSFAVDRKTAILKWVQMVLLESHPNPEVRW